MEEWGGGEERGALLGFLPSASQRVQRGGGRAESLPDPARWEPSQRRNAKQRKQSSLLSAQTAPRWEAEAPQLVSQALGLPGASSIRPSV